MSIMMMLLLVIFATLVSQSSCLFFKPLAVTNHKVAPSAISSGLLEISVNSTLQQNSYVDEIYLEVYEKIKAENVPQNNLTQAYVDDEKCEETGRHRTGVGLTFYTFLCKKVGTRTRIIFYAMANFLIRSLKINGEVVDDGLVRVVADAKSVSECLPKPLLPFNVIGLEKEAFQPATTANHEAFWCHYVFRFQYLVTYVGLWMNLDSVKSIKIYGSKSATEIDKAERIAEIVKSGLNNGQWKLLGEIGNPAEAAAKNVTIGSTKSLKLDVRQATPAKKHRRLPVQLQSVVVETVFHANASSADRKFRIEGLFLDALPLTRSAIPAAAAAANARHTVAF